MPNILKLDEYVHREIDDVKNLHYWLTKHDCLSASEEVKEENAKRLGCFRFSDTKVKCGGWAGLVRLSDTKELGFTQDIAVLPRKLNTDQAHRVDLVAMYLACLADPIVAAHLGEPAVFIWHDQEPIECPEELKNDALIFLVLSYLQELNQLCLRHLRNQFIRTSENLTGRIKGRIDIAKQVRVNMPRGRPDRTTCDFTIHSNNCRENKILKTALERSSRLLTKHVVKSQPLWSKVHFCRNELVGVEEIEVTPGLFQGIRYTGLFHPYKKAHALAKAILNAIPPDPHSADSSIPTKIPPFAICTFELFERYCEVQLRKLKFTEQSDIRLWVGYQETTLGRVRSKRLRPDFLLCSTSNPSHRWIIDAKNKPAWTEKANTGGSSEWDLDVPQLCRYSRFTHILDELGYEKKEHPAAAPKMLVVYPSDQVANPQQLNVDFFQNPSEESSIPEIINLFSVGIDVPTR